LRPLFLIVGTYIIFAEVVRRWGEFTEGAKYPN
jgi:hypothetical protein